MQRSGSQKALLVISIISIVFAVIGILLGLMTLLGGALVGAVPAEDASEALAGSGINQAQAGVLVGVMGFVTVLISAFELVVGILGVRAANDNQKIMPVWVLAIVELVLCVIAVIMVFVNGTFATDGVSSILSLAIGALIFWIANNIKKEAGR